MRIGCGGTGKVMGGGHVTRTGMLYYVLYREYIRYSLYM